MAQARTSQWLGKHKGASALGLSCKSKHTELSWICSENSERNTSEASDRWWRTACPSQSHGTPAHPGPAPKIGEAAGRSVWSPSSKFNPWDSGNHSQRPTMFFEVHKEHVAICVRGYQVDSGYMIGVTGSTPWVNIIAPTV